ncbi:MAG TPA: nucleotidyltransferase family protein, partial [Silvibacterium sp.]|nr:nucleotidyltransferase family protein [Silvibacterium sp.]
MRTQTQPVFERAREATFLITCLRGLSPPVSEDIHWQALERMARENGVLPLLWHSLQRAGVEMAEAFVAAALESRKAAERLASELDRLLPLFGERGIEVLPLKGPAIALELYGDAAL